MPTEITSRLPATIARGYTAVRQEGGGTPARANKPPSAANAHERYDCFVADQIRIRFVGPEPVRKAFQEPRLVQYLAMRATHCAQAMAVLEKTGHARVDDAPLIFARRTRYG